MSNLSELLPAGAGAKSASFVASGTLGSGVTVALKADGTVEAISGATGGVGTPVVMVNVRTDYTSSTYDSTNNKIVVVYQDQAGLDKGTAVVGTVSGSSISFGTAVVFEAGVTRWTSTVYDSQNNKVVVLYQDVSNSSYGTAIVGTVSGTSISFGTAVVFEAASTDRITAVFDSSSNKVVISYRDLGNSTYGTAIVGTVSGTSISFGTPAVFSSVTTTYIGSSYDSISNKHVIAYTASGGKAIVGTVSGTSISFGTAVTFAPAAEGKSLVFDSVNNKTVVCYFDTTTKGTAVVGTVSGTSISFGTAASFSITTTPITASAAVYDVNAKKVVVSYRDVGNSGYGTAIVGTVSGTSISFDTPFVFEAASTEYITSAYDSTSGQTVVSYRDGGNSNYGTSVVIGLAYTNSADFIGITDQAIADTATGAVIVQGGVSEKAKGLAESSFGSASVFESATSNYISAVYDSSSNKIVIAYEDSGNSSYGTAVVGTVSGTGISFGTPVVFESAITQWPFATFDSTNNKVVIAYRDYDNSNKGTAIVGTVSGTSISFGSAAVFENAAIGNTLSATYDSTNQKVVIAYRDTGNSNYGTAIVGTVSGTSISFGTAVVFESAACDYFSATYDSANQKVVIAYRDEANSDYGTAVVGTVSGTSISFGTAVVFASSFSFYFSATYDSTNQKVVIAYRDLGNSSYGTAVVGTVSGTSISFGTAVVFETASSSYISAAYDSASNKVVIAYQDSGNSGYGTAIVGTVSGTSISFGTAVVFETASSTYISAAYDSTNQKIVTAYKDSGNSNYGTGIVSSIAFPLTPNTDYYVQDDGTLSTTVSSAPAGRALSSTSILLEG